MSDRFEHHARTVTLLTFVSRVTGLVRDAALARVFGVSAITDAFWFAFVVPNLFRRLFGEGALSAAFLPEYARLDRENPAVARRLAQLTLGALVLALGGLTVVGELILLALLSGVSGAVDNHTHLALRLMMIMLPYMPMVCIVAMLGAMLQVHGRFGPTAAAPIVLNLCIVAAAVGWAGSAAHGGNREALHITAVALAVLLAGALQVAWSIKALRRGVPRANAVFDPAEHTNAARASLRRVLRQAGPMFLGLGVLQLNAFFDNLIASYPTTVGPTIFGRQFPLEPGALTALSNAQRLYEFPLGVFGIAVATAIFPSLARVGGGGDADGAAFAAILRRGLRLVVFIGLPASAGLILVRHSLTAVVFQGGDFTAADTARVAFVLLGYAPAIWAYSMIHTLTRAFYAKGDTRTPVKVAVGMVALNLALNVTLIWTPLKEAGLAWSTATCSTVQVLILLGLSRRFASGLIDGGVRASWLKTIAITAAMTVVVLMIQPLLPARHLTWGWAMMELGVVVSVGTTVIVAGSVAAKMPEIWWALGRREER